MKRKTIFILLTVLLAVVLGTTVLADDGEMYRKNVSKTPDLETEHAALKMLPVYVPAQASDGTLLTEGIDYFDAEGNLVETREVAQPLIAFYGDGHVETIDEEGYGGFPGHGERDAFAAVSLDDGATWKRTNLSQSADRSSINIRDGKKWVAYPGDVGRNFIASDGNQVLAVWVSKYCGSGSPGYSMTATEQELLAEHLVSTGTIADAAVCTDGDPLTPCTYLEDSFGVSGSQGVQSGEDLAADGYPLVGDYPYSCLWAARGVLMPPAAEGESSNFIWFKAERLSSGVRSANRPEAGCVKGAGCVVTWQEDPEGIRPGEGDGPGEGWSGAVAHHQTDTWYSFIDWDDLGLVSADGTYGSFYNDTGDLAEWLSAGETGSPKAAVPMSIPIRLTDNAMCTADDSNPYCHIDYDGNGLADLCASTVQVTIETPEGPTQDVDMCVTEDGRLMRGNTASTRARLGLHGYSTFGDYSVDPAAYPIDSAWFYMAYEENKGLGDEGEDEETAEDLIDKVDMGKNVWYHTFEMFRPELVSQGLMLNQPAVYPDDFSNPEGFLTAYGDLGYNFYQIDPDPVYETLAGLDTTLLQSEIARRPSSMSQDWYDAGESGLVGFQLWKQGIIRRGGPADVMARRFVMPDLFDPAVDNPYDYANMECVDAEGNDALAFSDGSNPRYVKGLCAAPALNMSATTVLTSETCGDATGCLDAFPFNDYFDDLDMTDADPISKIYTWQMYGPGYGETPPDDSNLDDNSWDNPYDMAKGHRGYLAGDMIMMMYAWTPNWNDLTNAHSVVNLYIRRSFDGGLTWSTLPASYTHTNAETYSGDGTTTCEWMGPISEQTPVCVDYGAGEFEQARNVSQLLGSQVTVLDPRYSPTTRSITEASVSTASLPEGFDAPLYLDDTRDPSLFFMVYETGETSAYDAGEATPLDLFYSRAIDWGDDYLVWQDEASAECLPAVEDTDLAGFCNEFDSLEGSKFSESGEASVTSSPGGQFLYAVWNQIDFDKAGHEVLSDAIFRRVMYLEGVYEDDDGDGGNDEKPGNGSGKPETPPGQQEEPDDPSGITTIPHIEARTDLDIIESFKWDLGTTLAMAVNGKNAGQETVVVAPWDPNITYVRFDYDIEAGDTIVLTDGETTLSTTVTDVKIIEVDENKDMVTGTGTPNSDVEVWACWADGCSETLTTKVNKQGGWFVNFASFDILPGMRVDAGQRDIEDNYTIFGFEVFAPTDPPGNAGSSALFDVPEAFSRRGFTDDNPGRFFTPLIAGNNVAIGGIRVWNDSQSMFIQVDTEGEWLLKSVHIFVGMEDTDLEKNGNPIPGNFPYKLELEEPVDLTLLTLDLQDEFEFNWGRPWEDERVKIISVHTSLVQVSEKGKITGQKDAWAYGPDDVTNPFHPSQYNGKWRGLFTYELVHPRTAHFIDSPVGGLGFDTGTAFGKTDGSGGFLYFPGEVVDLTLGAFDLGSAIADHKISPLDIYESADTDDPRVINMARLLQSLDEDAAPKSGIMINGAVEACLNETMAALGLDGFDFSDDAQIESIIQGTIAACADKVALVAVSAEDAKANLDRSLDTNMFRKNISRSPDLTSSKSKLNIMGVWFPAMRANGELTEVEYFDSEGNLIRTETEAKPIVAVYTDGIEETGYEDIWAAISRDDGNTFKRMNLSRAADRTSFTLENGQEFYGEAKKPVFAVKGNNILVAWTSKFCKGGKPAYAIDPNDEYIYDDPYYQEDIWGVAGPQRSVDYAEQDIPEVGEIPYSCVWVARGTIVTDKMLASSKGNNYWTKNSYGVGDIVWFKPERLTSGRRDANQVFMGAADGVGFAIAWQEDPEGLRPGEAEGPGPGWGGATTNHKTDIWYSYITMWDFAKVDENFVSGGDPQHDLEITGRPKVLVPMSMPVRITDNDALNTDNMRVLLDENGYPVEDEFGNWIPDPNTDSMSENESDGTHVYGYTYRDELCASFYEFYNNQDALKRVCVTADGRLLNGDTGASRPNLFLQPYTKPDGTKSAWAIFAYEETKGMGSGSPDHDSDEEKPNYGSQPVPEEGKNAIYHSFDFQTPDLVSAGDIMNLPERDAEGNVMFVREVSLDETGNVVFGDLILDWQGNAQIAYENARRPRFILQGKSGIGESRTIMLALYREGREGSGRPADIFARRVVAPEKGNPYAFKNFVCNQMQTIDLSTEFSTNPISTKLCVDGAMNLSTVTPTITTDSQGDPTSDDPFGAVKVIQWEQTVDNLDDPSWTNPYEDSRAHRGAIRGDFIVMGFTYTPNWAAARNGNDKYDFFVRRSFDGGVTWTTDPEGDGVTHCQLFKPIDVTLLTEGVVHYDDLDIRHIKVEEFCTTYAAGEFEQMRNLSQLTNSKESVIEPRIVGTPGSIKVDGLPTGKAEDIQNPDVFYVSYGTSTNPPIVHGDSDEVQEYAAPLDLFYSFSMNRGEDFVEVTWIVNPDSDGNYAGEEVTRWDWLAKGDDEQGEAQLRMTPDGSRFYATWLQEGEEGSDIWFRRVMSPEFPQNVAPVE